MEERELKKLYRKFLAFHKKRFLEDASLWVGVENLHLSKNQLEAVFENYERDSYLIFARKVRCVLQSPNAFQYAVAFSTEQWGLERYLVFLTKEGCIRISRNGRVTCQNKSFEKLFVEPMSREQARVRVQKKLRRKLQLADPVTSLFPLELEAKYDQMPISVSSALFLVEKITEYIPLKKKFLFVGDDDFVSVFLTMANPEMEALVIDIDEDLLSRISKLAKKYELKIETRRVDLRKKQKLGGRFTGFLVNPAYNFEGVKQFVSFGLSQLAEDGGSVFVEIGDEAIGNRFLFLQEFFAQKGLRVREVAPGNISYPWVQLHEEDAILAERLGRFVSREAIEKAPKLASSLWVFDRIPFEVKHVAMKGSIYSYI